MRGSGGWRISLSRLFRVAKAAVPAVYIAGAFLVWMNFVKANPDGLANIGIVLYTLPVALFGIFVLKLEFPFAPGAYYHAHGLYFSISVATLATLLFTACLTLERLVHPRVSANLPPHPTTEA